MKSPTYLLVHGAWGGAWCWRDLGVAFDRLSVAWRAVDLPSSKNGADPSTGLAADADAVAMLVTDDGPYVLVGHSYGGVVVTEVAPRIPNLQLVVYVAALIPNMYESARDTSRKIRVRTLLDDAIEVDGDYLRLNADGASAALYNDCSTGLAQWAVDQLSTQTIASFRSHRSAENVDKKSLYIRCSRDQTIDPSLQQLLSENCDSVQDLESGHSPFFSQPSVLCDAILS